MLPLVTTASSSKQIRPPDKAWGKETADTRHAESIAAETHILKRTTRNSLQLRVWKKAAACSTAVCKLCEKGLSTEILQPPWRHWRCQEICPYLLIDWANCRSLCNLI